MGILLQHKIFVGYFFLMAVIGSMVAIVLHERRRVQKIEDESIAIFQIQHNINTAHRHVTALVTYGESVMAWNKEDSLAYRELRVRADSMLQVLRATYADRLAPYPLGSQRGVFVPASGGVPATKGNRQPPVQPAVSRNHPNRPSYSYPQEERDSQIFWRQGNRAVAICHDQTGNAGQGTCFLER